MQKNWEKYTKAGRFFWMQFSLDINQFGLGFSTIWDRSWFHIDIDFLFLHFQFDFMGKEDKDLERYPSPAHSLAEIWNNEEDEVWNDWTGEEE